MRKNKKIVIKETSIPDAISLESFRALVDDCEELLAYFHDVDETCSYHDRSLIIKDIVHRAFNTGRREERKASMLRGKD